jgi:uncharacterized 2Fe-2S/4Fe-4S cluster protein (DUF4445 family)
MVSHVIIRSSSVQTPRHAMSREVKVIFEPSGRHVYVLPETVILEAAARAGFILQTPCGGAGTCGKCLVRIRAGHCPPTEQEKQVIDARRLAAGFRLACQARIREPLTIDIPDSSLFQSQQKILTSDTREPVDVRPRVRKCYLELPPPTHEDARSDLDRITAVTGPVTAALSALRALPRQLREAGFKVTAVIVDDELIAIEPGDTAAQCFGMAFDIGSTTVVGTLVDLTSGRDLAVAARINPQTSFGDDVLSRIRKCREEADGLDRLRTAVVESVNSIIAEVVDKAGIDRHRIYDAIIAGNTTMQQILCGIDPSALGELPFVPAFTHSVRLNAAALDLDLNPECDAFLFPQIGGFVGGDTVAGVVATRLDREDKPAILVDIGTNGEIVLAHEGRLIATSVAAGPAFEGARIVHGMRATSGAIEKVVLDGDVGINVIGDVRPAGICGTGLIDAAAELLRAGILDAGGRIGSRADAPASTPDAIRARIVESGGENHFQLVSAADSATGEPILIHQRDIRELQLASGAIRAGINILMRMEGLQPGDIGSILLAGAFGNFIRRRNARRIGMLPPVSCSRIRFVGNAASFGAKRVLLSTAEKDYAADIVRKTRHVDLSLDPEFMLEFSAAMLLPDHEGDACPD